jgi:chromosome segregation ATPase
MTFGDLLERKRNELDRSRQELERLQAQTRRLEDEVATLEKAIAIAEQEGLVAQGADKVVSKPKRDRKKRVERKAKPPAGRTLAAAIREIVKGLEPPFTTGDVRDQLRELEPELLSKSERSLAGTMRRMAITGELTPVEKGGPGKEATYGLPQGGGGTQLALVAGGEG